MMSKKAVVLSLIALLAITQIVNAHEGHSHDDDEDEEDEGGEDHVLVLTTKNFDETIAAHKFILVEFYAPWCGHCKSLAPEYAKAADILKGEEVKLAKVDATEESSLGERFNVKGYPTLKFFRDGKASEYNGGRTASEIVAWLRKKTGPAAKPIADAAALQAFQSSADAVVVGYFAQDGADKDAFLAAAAANDDLSFGLVSDASVSADAKFPSVVVYKTFDEKRNDFTGPFTADEITAFTGASSVPLVMEFNDDNVKKIFGSKIANKALFFIDYDAADYKSQLEQYRSVAETHKGKAVFATVNKDKSQVLEYFGLEEKNLPVFFMLKMSEDNDMKKYKHEGTVSDLSSFITSYLAGNVKPFLKSEPIPTGDNGEAVRTLVGLNFNTVVFDETKDVLVEFYAPWCGHCKSLAPKYEKLAKKFSSVSSIVIAKIDSTANDVENVEVSGFPTIKFWPAGKKDKAIDYDGARTVKGLTKFLKEHATVKFDLQEKKADDEGKEDL